jgi:5-methylcytosine-specific restriction endonuclease McrA
MKTKTCSVCKQTKTLDGFSPRYSRRDGERVQVGHEARCKTCRLEQDQKRDKSLSPQERSRQLAVQRMLSADWRKRNPHAVKAVEANRRARKMGVHGVLTREDVKAVWDQHDGRCWVCGHEATQLDHYRPINGKGGGSNTAGNVRPICEECNHKRSRFWVSEDVVKQEVVLLRELKHLFNVAGEVRRDVGQPCEDCNGTGWYGDNGPGIVGNSEFVRCDCGTGEKCGIGCHPYVVIGGVAWCRICNREADLEICRISHVLPNDSGQPRLAQTKKEV